MKEIYFAPNGKNRTKEVVEALLQAEDNTLIVFEKGRYDFYLEDTYRGYFFIGCNCCGEKRVVFPLLNKKNITIDGNGALFLFHDRVFPFIVQNCQNVTLKNFRVDFSFPRCLEAMVSRVDENGFELLLDKEYGCYVNERGNLLIPAGTQTFSSAERRYFLEQRNWHCFISVGDIYYENLDNPADVIYCNAEKTEEGVYFHYTNKEVETQFIVGKKLLLSYDEMRENDVIFLESSKNTLLQNVRIIHGAGMGIVGQMCENLTLDSYMVSPNDGDMYSTTADGVLLTNFTGKVEIKNCLIDRSIDDAMSIHGFYVRVEKITGEKKIVAKLVHREQKGTNIFVAGDRVSVSDAVTMDETRHLHIKDAFLREDPSLIHLEFEEDISNFLKAGDYIGNEERTPEIEIRNCVFKDFPSLRLSSSKKIVFENNVVKNCNALVLNDLMQYWSVTGRVNDVTICNNTFENAKYGVHAFVMRLAESNVKHKNVKIIGNRFVNCKVGIVAENVDGLIIRDNVFEEVEKETIIENCVHVELS